MPIELTMPKFGLTMHEGTVQRFFKAVGESVRAGQALYEVETEKILYEVEAPASGTLALRLCEDGETVECGRLVAVIAEPGEDVGAIAARYRAAESPAPGAAPPIPPAAAGRPAGAGAVGAGRRPVSPVARKLAAELGVVTGTGPGGRVTREDVQRAAAAPAAMSHAPAKIAPRGSAIALRGMRKTIAERMHQSLQHSAQLTIVHEADVSDAVEFRARHRSESDFTYTDLIIYAVARALTRHPRMNARMAETEILLSEHVNVGMAVALDEGLIVPVIFGADRKSLREIAVETKALGEKARAGTLRLEDITGGTFTVTNLGLWGVDAFTPILNPGETGILGVGRIVEKPVIHRGEIARRSMMTLSLTFDHRVIDGAPAARFLTTVTELFNRPES